jgi:hypothetical protein
MAKGILGRKLGMTQVFDPETGVVTSVTVIAAGPCPVVQVKSNETDGYEAVQLAFDAVPERKLTRPELGHLKRYGIGPYRKLVEFKGQLEGVRDRNRQRLPGHDQAPQLRAGPTRARLAQHPRPRLDRRLRVPVTRFQGDQAPRPDGR